MHPHGQAVAEPLHACDEIRLLAQHLRLVAGQPNMQEHLQLPQCQLPADAGMWPQAEGRHLQARRPPLPTSRVEVEALAQPALRQVHRDPPTCRHRAQAVPQVDRLLHRAQEHIDGAMQPQRLVASCQALRARRTAALRGVPRGGDPADGAGQALVLVRQRTQPVLVPAELDEQPLHRLRGCEAPAEEQGYQHILHLGDRQARAVLAVLGEAA
mmetsp:Transcript_42899/g.124018  ORF Transcript_42899/g.124018 Transcript_42899/m.124018 type:complete len:213 (+) Transcript_42899:128-766(+)